MIPFLFFYRLTNRATSLQNKSKRKSAKSITGSRNNDKTKTVFWTASSTLIVATKWSKEDKMRSLTPGSSDPIVLPLIEATSCGLISTPITRCPAKARQTAKVRPTLPDQRQKYLSVVARL